MKSGAEEPGDLGDARGSGPNRKGAGSSSRGADRGPLNADVFPGTKEGEGGGGVELVATCDLPTEHGFFKLNCYVDGNGREHLAYHVGDLFSDEGPVLCRVHSECLTGDALGSKRCDCGPQLRTAMRLIQERGRGVVVYLRQEGRGIGLVNKIRAYSLQDGGMDTVDANVALGLPVDARSFAPAAAILAHLGVGEIDLLTNNPDKIRHLEAKGVKIARRTPLEVGIQSRNRHYLATKVLRMGHLIEDESVGEDVADMRAELDSDKEDSQEDS